MVEYVDVRLYSDNDRTVRRTNLTKDTGLDGETIIFFGRRIPTCTQLDESYTWLVKWEVKTWKLGLDDCRTFGSPVAVAQI